MIDNGFIAVEARVTGPRGRKLYIPSIDGETYQFTCGSHHDIVSKNGTVTIKANCSRSVSIPTKRFGVFFRFTGWRKNGGTH